MDGPGEPSQSPLWRPEEHASKPERPGVPHYPGWGTGQAYPSPAVRKRPRGALIVGTLSRVAAVVITGVLTAGFSLYLHGDLKPSAILGGPAASPATTAAAGESGGLIYHTAPDPNRNRSQADAGMPDPFATYPTPGREEHAVPLGTPARVTDWSTAYAFMDTSNGGQPVTYDPCRPIHYVTRAANSPAAGPKLIEEAVAAVSRATGLMFIDDGATTEAPSKDRQSYQPDRYGDRWAPVLIAWETSAEEPRFTNPEYGDTVLGLGGSDSVGLGNRDYTYVSGQLTLNGPGLQTIIEHEGPAPARGTIEHELAHVVGLDHVQDPTQLMNPTDAAGLSTYQAGDLTGLSILGRGECRPGL